MSYELSFEAACTFAEKMMQESTDPNINELGWLLIAIHTMQKDLGLKQVDDQIVELCANITNSGEDTDTRTRATNILIETGDERVVEPLINCLRVCASELYSMPDMANFINPRIDKIAGSLNKITGKKFFVGNRDPNKWEEWWSANK